MVRPANRPNKTRSLVRLSGTWVNDCGSVMRLVLGTLAIAATVAFLVSGCSPEIGFPAVHDMPAPRADTPLTPDEVKQATDNLISERDHLSTATQGNGQPSTAANTSGGATPKKPATAVQPTAQTTDAGAAMTAGAYAKP